MRINNKNKIESLRIGIEETVTVLGRKISLADDATGTDLKGSIKIKKVAFTTAKNLLAKLQALETDSSSDIDLEWYRNTIEKLVASADEAVKELSRIMKDYVLTDKVETSASIANAITSKEDAYYYIEDISQGVLELSKILNGIEAGDGLKLLTDDDFKTGHAEAHSYDGTLFYHPKKRKVQPGYNAGLDAIVISYDGTVGEIIDCYGLRIALPKAPKKASFDNSRKKDHLQYWERPLLPKGLKRETAHLFDDEIEEEFRRRDDGYWFLNNGEPEYVTGSHYMLLTHMRTDAYGGYFHYRKAHRDLFYFLEAAWVDNRCLGTILGKTRRTGATFVAIAFLLTKGTTLRSVNMGLTSKTDRDAKKVFERLSVMFKHLPFFFKPLNTGEGLTKELAFERPSQRTTKNNQGKEVQYEELNTVIDFQPTSEDSYDGMTVKFYIGDEFSKWTRGDILSHYSKVKKTLTKGSRIHGKAFLLSTLENVTGNDADDENAKCGDKFKQLYYDSIPSQRMEDGMTKSGLYKVFISSLDNYEGHIDLYGNCIKNTPEEPIIGVDGEMIHQGVQEFLESRWESLKNKPGRLNDERRKDPITEEDMFRVASKDSRFNVLKIQDQVDYNTHLYLESGQHGYKIGNFRWIDTEKTKVEFVETKAGRFKVSWLPDASMANAKTIKNGHQAPVYDYVGVFGIDPYKHNQVSKGSDPSKGAIIGYLMSHPIDGVPKESFFLTYIGRPPTFDIFFDDAIMCMIYYSMQGLIENNIPALLHEMHSRGLTKYAMRRPDKSKLSPDEFKYGGIPSTDTKLLDRQAQFLEKYIEDHLGYADTEEYRPFGAIGDCPFNEMLVDFMKFDINNRTKHDATVAACLAVFGAQKFALKHQQAKQQIKATDFYSFYNNMGSTPKRLNI